MKRSRETGQHRSPHHQTIRDKAINRYLAQHAEAICQQMPLLGPQGVTESTMCMSYEHVLVIPAFDEPVGCLDHVLPPTLARTLVIVVVNAAEDSDRAAIDRTQQLWQSFQREDSDTPLSGSSTPQPKRYHLIAHSENTTVLVIDCCTEGNQLPPNQGVGLARKVGGDIALTYMAQGVVTSDWIHYTDADVKLPDDFFQMELSSVLQGASSAQPKTQQDDIAVVLYPFRHQPPNRHILLYELSLRYYVTELAKARSPYAFHTIGSLMCVNGLHYAKVRGFPKRKAAEDFYMLNKLAKTGTIVQLQAPIVQLDSRLSHRVPFGTGAMMTKLTQLDEFVFYHPAVFQHLREWMDCIDALWPPIYETSRPSQSLDASNDYLLSAWLSESPWQGACWINCLVDMGLEKTLKQAYRQSRDRHHFYIYMHTWFDAFRTLKFVHYLREHHYPSLAVEEWASLIIQEKFLGGDAHPTKLNLRHLKDINQYFCDLEARLGTIVGPTTTS